MTQETSRKQAEVHSIWFMPTEAVSLKTFLNLPPIQKEPDLEM